MSLSLGFDSGRSSVNEWLNQVINPHFFFRSQVSYEHESRILPCTISETPEGPVLGCLQVCEEYAYTVMERASSGSMASKNANSSLLLIRCDSFTVIFGSSRNTARSALTQSVYNPATGSGRKHQSVPEQVTTFFVHSGHRSPPGPSSCRAVLGYSSDSCFLERGQGS